MRLRPHKPSDHSKEAHKFRFQIVPYFIEKYKHEVLPNVCLTESLRHDTLDGGLEVLDLVIELTLAVGLDGAGNDGTGDSASVSEGNLAGDEDVVDVLLLADQRQVQQDLDGLSIGGQNDEVSLLAVQGLSGFRFQEKRVLRVSMSAISQDRRTGNGAEWFGI